ncbi:MAG: hypothetical protein ABSA26_14605, partial [Thermoguttaceae bacterium]
REKRESHPVPIRDLLQGKDLIQSGMFSIPNPVGGVKSKICFIPDMYIAQNTPLAELCIIWLVMACDKEIYA